MAQQEGSPQSDLSVEEVQAICRTVRENVAKVIISKADVVDLVLVAMLSEGHILMEDVPGVGKTMLARATAASLGCTFNRIQCTPDLLPSDITGVSVFDQKTSEFVFRSGPVMSQLLLADEVNRATPRTQSSLLECMAEGQVTVDGTTHILPRPFLVMATQNPIEYEGTFPLPEAQLDRFLIKMSIGYPTVEEENEILRRLQHRHPIETLTACTTPEVFTAMQRQIRNIYVEDSVREYTVRLAQATRHHPDVVLGASPRGSLGLLRAGQALAALRGREYVLPDDIKHLAVAVFSHRIVLKPESQLRGGTAEHLVREVLERTPLNFEAVDSQ